MIAGPTLNLLQLLLVIIGRNPKARRVECADSTDFRANEAAPFWNFHIATSSDPVVAIGALPERRSVAQDAGTIGDSVQIPIADADFGKGTAIRNQVVWGDESKA
ncbi:MAG: hypothetical protein ACR2RE_19345 [Geminicoccaceae bacterium]